MKKIAFLAAFSLFLGGCAEPGLELPEGAYTVLADVTVIDGTGGAPVAHRDVVLADGRIYAVAGVGAYAYPEGTEVLGLTGHYVMPGLIDMHAHVTILPMEEDGRPAARYDPDVSARVLRLLLAHGVTTVRNPAAPTADGVALRDSVERGAFVGPRILTAGAALNRGTFGPFVAVQDAEAVRAEVRRQAEAGVDFIKVYAALPPALVRAAVEEAHRQGLPVVGHLQRTTWTEAARMGIDAVTHGAPWSPAYLPEAAQGAYRQDMRGRIYWLEHLDLGAEPVQEMAAALAEHHVGIDPTLIAYHTKFWGDDPRYLEHPDLGLVPEMILQQWRRGTSVSDWSAEDFTRAKAAWPRVLALTRLLYERGVVLTAGSDLPNPWVIPGVGLHEELELLVEAGIPPLAVLRIATFNGALTLGLGDELGTVEAGKRADLLVLRADPTQDIRQTRSIVRVCRDGICRAPAALLGG